MSTHDASNDYVMKSEIATKYKDLLCVDDLASIFKVSRQTIYKEIKNGKFGQPIQIGRAYKIPKLYIMQRYFQTQ